MTRAPQRVTKGPVRRAHPKTGHICRCAGWTEFPHSKPIHCSNAASGVDAVPKFWWHMPCFRSLPPRMKYLGHKCPKCEAQRSLAEGGRYRNVLSPWFHGSYEGALEYAVQLEDFETGGASPSGLNDGVDTDAPMASSCHADVSHHLTFKFEVSKRENAERCDVCLEETNSFVDYDCSHSMCALCHEQWFARNNTCHMCRQDLKPRVKTAPAVDETCKGCGHAMSHKRAAKKDLCNRCSNCETCGNHMKSVVVYNLSRTKTVHSCDPCFRLYLENYRKSKNTEKTAESSKPLVFDDDMCVHILPVSWNHVVAGYDDVWQPSWAHVYAGYDESVAPKAAAARKRGIRGGKRNLADKNGACYLKLFATRDRPAAYRELGRNPRVEDVFNASFNPTTVTKKLTSNNGRYYHVRPDQSWDILGQVSYLLDEKPRAIVGASEADLPLAAIGAEEFMSDEEMKLEHSYAFQPAMVGGAGDCWKKLPYVPACVENDFRITARELYEGCKVAQRKMLEIRPNYVINWYVKLERTADGDWHIDDVKVIMSRVLRARYMDYMGWSEFLGTLLENEWRVVGKADVSPYDQATQQYQHPENLKTVEDYTLPIIAEEAMRIRRICPYAIPAINQDRMKELSIPWSAKFSAKHDHPIHAAIRRLEVYEWMPRQIVCDCTVVSMSNSNYRMLQTALESKQVTLKRFNPIADVKDIGRYANSGDVPKQVFSLPKIDTPMAAFHNSGQFMNEASLMRIFLENPNLMFVYVSFIFPLASLITEYSPQPTLYNYYVQGDTLIYIPEGHAGGKYEQPRDPRLLLARTITSADGKVTLQGAVVESTLNTHAMMWSRFAVTVPKTVALTIPGMMEIPRLFRGQRNSMCLVPRRIYTAMISYGKSLPKVTKLDLWGKLRQFEVSEGLTFPTSHKEAFIIAVLMVIGQDLTPDLQSKFYDSLMGEIKYKTIGHVIRWFDKMWAARYSKRICDMVDENTDDWLFPAVDVHLQETAEPEVYGVSWKVPEGVRSNFMRRLDFWLRSKLSAKFRAKHQPKWEFDEEGYLVNNVFLHLNSRTIAAVGSSIIEASQIYQWLRIFDGLKVTYFSAEGLIQDEEATLVGTEEGEAEPMKTKQLNWIVKQHQAKKAVEEARAAYAKEMALDRHKYDTAHLRCMTCGYLLTEHDQRVCVNQFRFNEFREALTQYADEFGLADPNVPYRRVVPGSFSSQSSLPVADGGPIAVSKPAAEYHDSTTSDSDSSDAAETAVSSVVSMTSNDSLLSFDSGRGLENNIQRLLADFKRNKAPNLSLAREEIEWTDRLEQEYSGKSDGVAYEDRVAAWAKMARAAPHPRTPYHASGATLWDSVFPRSMGKRVLDCPYHQFTRFAKIPYPENDCIYHALHLITNIPHEMLHFAAILAWPKGVVETQHGLPDLILHPIGLHFGLHIVVETRTPKGKKLGNSRFFGRKRLCGRMVTLNYWNSHFSVGINAPPRVRTVTALPAIEEVEEPPLFKELIKEIKAIPGVEFVDWSPEARRAELLVREMWKGTTGTLGQSEAQKVVLKGIEDRLPQLAALYPNRKLAYIEGDPGCAKSSGVQAVLRKKKYHHDNMFNVTLPVNTLEADWKDKLDVVKKDPKTGKGSPSRYVSTFESTLDKKYWGRLMVRDEDKFQKGYTALSAILFPNAVYHLNLGDRYQSQKHEPNAQCLLNDPTLLGEGALYSGFSKSYRHGTYRFGPGIANFFYLPTFSAHPGGFHFSQVDILTPAALRPFFPMLPLMELEEKFKTRITAFAAHATAAFGEQVLSTETDTFAGTQGLSADLLVCYVDIRVLRMTDPRLAYTVLTRAKDVVIVLMSGLDGIFKQTALMNPVWGPLLEYYWNGYTPGDKVIIKHKWTANMKTILPPLPPGTRHMLAGPPCHCKNRDFVQGVTPDAAWDDWLNPFNLPLIGGARLDRWSDVYKDATQFKPHIIDWPLPKPPEPFVREPDVPEPMKLITHIPQTNVRMLREWNNSEILNMEAGELSYKQMFSEQKPDRPIWRADNNKIFSKAYEEARKLGLSRKDASKRATRIQFKDGKFNPEALLWGQRQLSSDGASFAAGVAQRIRRSTYEKNRQEVFDEAPYGHAMWQALKSYLGWGQKVPWDEALWEASLIEFQERRADRSEQLKKMSLNRSDNDYVDFLTAKNQWKLKSEHYEKAKPLQTILVRSDEYLFKFGPLGVYLLHKLQAHAPPWIYFHAQRTLKQMEDWCSQFSDSEEFIMCDISGFDASVRGGDVTLEQQFMRHFGVAEDLIVDYTEDKMNFHTKSMVFGIMRFSGEIFTWLFNSIHTAAREALKFNLRPGTLMAVSGDDVLRQGTKMVNPLWSTYAHYDKSVEKRFTDERGEFCSYITAKGLMVKSPIILWRRLQGQIERGKLDDVLLGYYEHFLANYRKGDALYEILTPEELEYVTAINNFFFREAKKLSPVARRLDWTKVNVDAEDRVRGTGIGLLSALKSLEMNWERVLSPISLEASIAAYSPAGATSTFIDDEF